MKQFLRRVTFTALGSSGMTINPKGSQGHQIKIWFDLNKTIDSEQNTGVIKLYNLAESTRKSLGRELEDITLDAGYEPPDGGSNVGTIFFGQILDARSFREGKNIVTELEVAEGDKAFRKSTISKTMPSGSTVEAIVEEIFKGFEKYGIERGEWVFPEGLEPLKRPYSMMGSAPRELDRLGAGYAFYWSIQSGVLEIIPSDGFLNSAVLLNARTGLVDVPAVTDTGVEFTALLNPEVRPNRQVIIESGIAELNAEGGQYRVASARFSGDNREGDFLVYGVGEAIEGGKVNEGEK